MEYILIVFFGCVGCQGVALEQADFKSRFACKWAEERLNTLPNVKAMCFNKGETDDDFPQVEQ
ncbi:MAG: hypothetical protein ABL936_00305 [Aestuariivirga sp.]